MESKREQIMQGVIAGVRKFGLESLSIKTISKLSACNVSSIYTYFNDKEDLLRCCFEKIDREIAAIFSRAGLNMETMKTDPEQEVRRVWTLYFRYLLKHPNETIFYIRYRDSAGFLAVDKNRDLSHYDDFLQIVHGFEQQYQMFQQIQPKVIGLHLLITTAMYAKYVIKGVLPLDAATEESIFQLEMNGLWGLLKPDPQKVGERVH